MKRNDILFSGFVVLLFAVVTGVTTYFHQPWRDEAQAWLLARDLDLGSLCRQVNYEGSPGLWHLILHPFARCGAPYATEFIIHCLLAIAAVSVFVLWSPFSKITKFLFVFSYLMAYEYSVRARSYVLTVLLVMILATMYRRRFELAVPYGLSVGLLFNTNVHSFAFAGCLMALFVLEVCRQRKVGPSAIAGIALMAIGAAAALAQVWPHEGLLAGQRTFRIPSVLLSNIFFGGVSDTQAPMAVLVLGVGLLALAPRPAVLWLVAPSFVWMFYVCAFKNPGAARSHGLLLIFMLFGVWVSSNYADRSWFPIKNSFVRLIVKSNLRYDIFLALLNVCLAASVLAGSLQAWGLTATVKSSGGRDAAEFLHANHLEDREWVGQRSFKVSAILPYFPGKKAWYADIEDYGSFVTWSQKFHRQRDVPAWLAVSRAKRAFEANTHLLLLLDEPIDDPQGNGLRAVWSSPQKYYGLGEDEYYFIYAPSGPDWGDRFVAMEKQARSIPSAGRPKYLQD